MEHLTKTNVDADWIQLAKRRDIIQMYPMVTVKVLVLGWCWRYPEEGSRLTVESPGSTEADSLRLSNMHV